MSFSDPNKLRYVYLLIGMVTSIQICALAYLNKYIELHHFNRFAIIAWNVGGIGTIMLFVRDAWNSSNQLPVIKDNK